jgi:hypothetical protein
LARVNVIVQEQGSRRDSLQSRTTISPPAQTS